MAKIMVIDDEEIIRNMIGAILKPSGYEIILAADGQDGIEKIKAGESVDLIITDFKMPRKNGLEVIKFAKGLNIPVIMISGEDGDIEDQARKLGVTTFLQKPVSLRLLVDIVSMVLRSKGAP